MLAAHLLFVTLTFLPIGHALSLDADEHAALHSGKSLNEVLAAPVSVAATNIRLNEQLVRLQRDWRIAIVRDRRTDPNRLISVKTNSLSRVQVLDEVSREVPSTSLTRAADLLFFGPDESAHRLPILMAWHRKELKTLSSRMPAASVRKLFATRPLEWKRLANPRELLMEQARLADVTILNPDAVPWDVWDAHSLLSLSFAESAALILHQFDLALTIEADSISCRIVSCDDLPAFEHRHQFNRPLRAKLEEQLSDEMPTLKPAWSQSSLTVTTSLKDHANIGAIVFDATLNAMASDSPMPSGSLLTRQFTLGKTQATVSDLIKAFREQGIDISVDDEASDAAQQTLQRVVRREAMTARQSGSEFFHSLFDDYFSEIELLDDKIVLKRPR